MTRYRVLPIAPDKYHVQSKCFFSWRTIGFYHYAEYFEPKVFPFKEQAEEYILGMIKTEKELLREQKELKKFKYLNPPYEFP